MDQLVVLQEIFESFSKGAGPLGSIDSRSITGSCAFQVGRLLESVKRGEIDGELCIKLADCLTDLYELKRLGDICRRAALYDVSLKCYNKALASSSDPQVRSVLMNNQGQVYARKGDLSRAVLYYRKAAEGFEAAGDASGAAHVLGNLGSAYRRGYDWDRSLENCFKSLKGFEKIEDELGVAQMTGSLGRIYSEMGQLDLSSLYFQRSLKEFERLGDRKNSAWLLNRLGRVEAEMGHWSTSLDHFNRSLAVFQEMDQPHNVGIVLSNMARMYLDRGEVDSARDALEGAMKMIRREMVPVYPNAVSSLAATYAVLAQKCRDRDGGGSRLASQHYAMASDRLTELSTFPGVYMPQLKVAAGLARSLSYIVRLDADPRDAEAVALAERAISALDGAVAKAEGSTRSSLEALQRTLKGMKGIWSMDLSRAEPWKQSVMIGEVVEYLMGGARLDGVGSEEARMCLFDALKAVAGMVESVRQRGSGREQMAAAASFLRRAEKRYQMEADGKAWSAPLTQAASKLEGLSASGDDLSGCDPIDLHKQVLLIIGHVLARDILSRVDHTDWIYLWDDGMNLLEQGPATEPGSRKKSKRSSRVEELSEIIPEPEEGERTARTLPSSPLADTHLDGGGALVPVCAGASLASTTAIFQQTIHPWSMDRARPWDRAVSRDRAWGQEPEIFGSRPEFIREERERMGDGPLVIEAEPSMRGGQGQGIVASGWYEGSSITSVAVKAAKVLAVVVLLLLAIDLILYLI